METGGGQETGRGGAQELSASLFPPTSRNRSGDGALTAFADGFLHDKRSRWHWGERRCSPLPRRRQQPAHRARVTRVDPHPIFG